MISYANAFCIPGAMYIYKEGSQDLNAVKGPSTLYIPFFHTICSILPSYFVLVLMIYIVDFSSLRKWILCRIKRASLERHHCHQTHSVSPTM